MIVTECLLDTDFNVVEASSGEEASVLIKDAPKAFKILVTDIHMPGKLNGIDVAELVHKHWPFIPVIVVFGQPDVFKARWRQDPRYALMAKPYTPRQLTAALDTALGRVV